MVRLSTLYSSMCFTSIEILQQKHRQQNLIKNRLKYNLLIKYCAMAINYFGQLANLSRVLNAYKSIKNLGRLKNK